MIEALLLVGLAIVIGAIGVALGILAAPMFERLSDRIGRDDDEEGGDGG